MTFIIRASSKALVLAGVLLAGCAGEGNDGLFTTGALGTSQPTAAAEPKVDPACVALTARIDALRKEGVAEKVEKASLKKYKMTHADLTKADQLNKANADFQSRCTSPAPKPTTAQSASPSYVPPKSANASAN